MKTKDIVSPGDRFGRWTIIKESARVISPNGVKLRAFLCRCDCGKESIVRWYSLKSGRSVSCGCYMRSHHSEGWKYPENLIFSRLYTIWASMKQRCYNKSSSSYKTYGAKGITICDDWKDDFMAFYNWALSNGYSDNLTIDRINSKGNYEPSNCRWATYKEQANNISTNLRFAYNGEEHTIHEWADIVGINAMALRYRIVYAKWTIEKALTTPLKKKKLM